MNGCHLLNFVKHLKPKNFSLCSHCRTNYLNEELVVVDGKVIFKPGISRFFHEAGQGTKA